MAVWHGFAPGGSVAFTTFAKSQKVIDWQRSPRFTGWSMAAITMSSCEARS